MAAIEPLDVRSLAVYDEQDGVVPLGLAMAILWQVGSKKWHGNVGQDVVQFIYSFT